MSFTGLPGAKLLGFRLLNPDGSVLPVPSGLPSLDSVPNRSAPASPSLATPAPTSLAPIPTPTIPVVIKPICTMGGPDCPPPGVVLGSVPITFPGTGPATFNTASFLQAVAPQFRRSLLDLAAPTYAIGSIVALSGQPVPPGCDSSGTLIYLLVSVTKQDDSQSAAAHLLLKNSVNSASVRVLGEFICPYFALLLCGLAELLSCGFLQRRTSVAKSEYYKN